MNEEMTNNVLAAIELGESRFILRYINEAAEQKRADKERMEKIVKEWEPLLQNVRAVIPEWARDYVSHPLYSPIDKDRVHPVRIGLLDIAVVYAYVVYHDLYSPASVRFSPSRYEIYDDEEEFGIHDTAGGPLNYWSIIELEKDFYIALYKAAEDHYRVAMLKNEVRRRNAERIKEREEREQEQEQESCYDCRMNSERLNALEQRIEVLDKAIAQAGLNHQWQIRSEQVAAERTTHLAERLNALQTTVISQQTHVNQIPSIMQQLADLKEQKPKLSPHLSWPGGDSWPDAVTTGGTS
jgi:uncharacterized small protein (DUF1192 family)